MPSPVDAASVGGILERHASTSREVAQRFNGASLPSIIDYFICLVYVDAVFASERSS
jgi:hypothetical protein